MVEPDRYPAWGKENGHPIADNQGSGVVDLETPAAMQLYRKDTEWFELPQPFQTLIEVIGCHALTPVLRMDARLIEQSPFSHSRGFIPSAILLLKVKRHKRRG